MSELFPPEVTQSDSPRLAWLNAHGVRYSRRRGCFTAWCIAEPMVCFTGIDLDECLSLLAAKNGWKTWNE